MPHRKSQSKYSGHEKRKSTLTGPLEGTGEYLIKFDKEAYTSLFSLIARNHEAAFAQALEILTNHVTQAPKRSIRGRLKELTAGYKGIYQITLPGSYRIWYTVDDSEKLVYVEYAGKHPEWSGHRAR